MSVSKSQIKSEIVNILPSMFTLPVTRRLLASPKSSKTGPYIIVTKATFISSSPEQNLHDNSVVSPTYACTDVAILELQQIT